MIELFLSVIIVLVVINILLNLRNQKPFAEANSNDKTEVLVDTCALIDGRIIELVKTGFLQQTLVVPQFVIAELQGLADGKDNLKRQRARAGLDMVKELQKQDKTVIKIVHDKVSSQAEVDDKLIEMAKVRSASLYTTDYNLSKVADIEGVSILNVNELSKVLKPVYLPGETAEVKIIEKGQSKGQGVGYLDDGTMIVVDNAATKLNQILAVKFEKQLQTSSGKMMFAKISK
ncbi:TRAM domain-containing protein [Candidatus Saccharibacteria bacterium]|nr:TRAM domain-containing protein [Candidatus Saccharibacteria bacterium]